MIKYFLKALNLVNNLLDIPKKGIGCRECEFKNECEIQDDKLCGYDKIEGDK